MFLRIYFSVLVFNGIAMALSLLSLIPTCLQLTEIYETKTVTLVDYGQPSIELAMSMQRSPKCKIILNHLNVLGK